VALEPGSTSNAPRSDVERSEIAMSSIKWLRHAFQILENNVVGEDDVLSARATGTASGSGSRNKGLKVRYFCNLLKNSQRKYLPVERAILRSLGSYIPRIARRAHDQCFSVVARAYYVSSFTETDNLARAEATLNELMNLMPAGGEQSENETPSVVTTAPAWY
jgi:hypothetical protein